MFRLPDSWLWDFWLAEDHGTYHLFFLHASRALHDPDRRHLRAAIGHATSTDLVHWEQVTDALVHGDPGEFDATATWTGSVVQGPEDRWYMFYTGTTATEAGLIQQIGLATSTDLHHWVKDQRNPLVQADSRWYETLGGQAPWQDEHWRDPFVMADPDGNGWHMLITARANTGPHDDRGVIGQARSTDLLNWNVQPPLSQPGNRFGQLEVFQVASIDGKHVLIFNCLPAEYSAERRAAGHRGTIWAATGESPLGPFDIKGATPLTESRYYVGKLVRDHTGRWVLLAFHNIGAEGGFVGALSDPMPVQWHGDILTIAHTPNAAADSVHTGPVLDAEVTTST
jgi:beta-fructofuranosidase